MRPAHKVSPQQKTLAEGDRVDPGNLPFFRRAELLRLARHPRIPVLILCATMLSRHDMTRDQDDDRHPTPCPACSSREISIPCVTLADMFSEAFNARPFPAIFCAGCGTERADLCPEPMP